MRKRILVVDDEESMVHLLRTILEATRYEVEAVTGGKEALALLERTRVDLILLDLMMPEMDGWEVFHELKNDERTASIPVVIITAKKDEIDRAMGTELLKVEGYISKPFVRRQLVQLVERIIGG